MRTHRSITVGVIAIVAIAAMLPEFAGVHYAIGEAVWVLLPDETPVPYDVPEVRPSEQPDPLLSLLASRAPPSFLHA